MTDTEKKNLVEKYVRAYNNLDVKGMVADLHENIIFKNILNGEVTLELNGIDAFKSQAEQAAALFSEREQKIKNIVFIEDGCRIDIAYQAIIAADMPNGMKAGHKIELNGKSVFRFAEGKISEIYDIS
jgi:ketosteroid isomerase-like protein